MGFFNKYPYTDFHEMNLDWFLNQFKELIENWEQFHETITSEWNGYKAGLNEEWASVQEAWNQLYTYVHDYFDNLDVQREIDNKLDKMVEDGTITNLFKPLFDEYKTEINAAVSTQNSKIVVLEGRMDTFSRLEEGSTTGDAELEDIRVSYNGETYPTAGDAVRAQVSSIQSKVTYLDKAINTIYGEGDLLFDTPSIEGLDQTAGATQLQRFSPYATILEDGKLESIVYGGAYYGNIRFYLGVVEGEHIRLLDNFVITTSSDKMVYTNGEDFIYTKKLPAGTIIGASLPSVKYGNTSSGRSYVRNSDGTFTTPTYDVAIGMQVSYNFNNKLDRLINGYGAKIPENTYVANDSDIIHVRVELTSGADKLIKIARNANTVIQEASRIDFVNFTQQTVGFYRSVGNTDTDNLVVYKQIHSPITFATGKTYDIFSIRLKGNINIITVYDTFAAKSFSYACYDYAVGSGWGYRKLYTGNGITVVSFDNFTLEPAKSRVCFLGDSYIEGNSIWSDKDKRYAALITKDINGDGFIAGQGGAKAGAGISHLINFVKKVNTSDFYLVAYGMNDTSLSEWKTQMDAIIFQITDRIGAIPVLATIPPVPAQGYDNNVHMQMNAYIRSLGYKYIDIARLLSVNNDGTTPSAESFLDDGVHPTVESHEKIYELFKATVPEVFGKNI